MRTAVIIMSRIPQPGLTKTRLTAVLSDKESSAFHRACLADICRTVIKSQLPGCIYYTGSYEDFRFASDKRGIWGFTQNELDYFEMYPQQGDNLGERLYNAADEMLTRYEAVLLIGSDMPDISHGLLLAAREKLLNNDIVIGPATDGGYYLLAVKQADPYIFRDIAWGTSEVLEKTLEKVKDRNRKFSLLESKSDIDTWDDLISFYCRGQSNANQLDAYLYAENMVVKYGISERGIQRVKKDN